MSLRIWVCAAVAVVGVSCKEKVYTLPPPSQVATVAPSAAAPALSLPNSPLERRVALEAYYRLPPDHRLLGAVQALRRIVTGAAGDMPVATWKGDRIELSSTEGGMGTLDAAPSFEATTAAVAAWLTKLTAAHPIATTGGRPSGDVWPSDAVRALGDAEAAWPDPSKRAGAAVMAVRSLAWMLATSSDALGVSEDLGSRAVAALLLAEKLVGGRLARERAVIAMSLGYGAEAAAAAQALPAGDFVRAWAGGDDVALLAAASAPTAPWLARYAWLKRLASGREQGVVDAWRTKAFRGERMSLPLLAGRSRSREFAEARSVSDVLPQLALLAAAQVSGDAPMASAPGDDNVAVAAANARAALGVADTDVVARFEAIAPRLPPVAAGPLDAGQTVRSYFRAAVYSAVVGKVAVLAETLGLPASARKYVDAMPPTASAVASDARTWLSTYVSIVEKAETAKLLPHLGAVTALGMQSRVSLFESMRDRFDWGDPAAIAAARALVARLDARPDGQYELGSVALTALSDLALGERSYAAATTADPGHFSYAEVYLAIARDDRPRMTALVADPTLTMDDTLRLLDALHEDEQLDARIARLSLVAQNDWQSASTLIGWLEKHDRRTRAREIAAAYLRANSGATSLETAQAHSTIARELVHDGFAKQALDEIQPSLTSGAFAPMKWAAIARAQLGDGDAEKIAQQALARYPGAGAVTLLARVRWILGDVAGAATGLAVGSSNLQAIDWRWEVGTAFGAVYGTRPVADGLAAADAIAKANIRPEARMQLAFGAADAKRHDLAFEILSRVQAPGNAQWVLMANTYGELAKWKGNDAANTWATANIPPAARSPFITYAFANGNDAAVWGLGEAAPSVDQNGDFDWLMRACATLRSEPAGSPHRADLLAHFQGKGGGSYFHGIGRHMVGIDDRATVAALATTPKTITEVSYYMGLRAQLDGKFDDASAFYRSALETGEVNVGEYRWAYEEIQRWKATHASLARLGAVLAANSK